MDEPTAVLAPQEVDDLFRTLRSMTAAGRSIVFISHKLGEVLAIADRITVMRRGRVTAAALPAAGVTKAQLATLMVGRPILESLERTAAPRATRSSRSRTSRRSATRGRPPCAASRSRSGPARSWASRRWRATARASWPRSSPGLRSCRGRVLVGGEDVANRSGPRGDRPRRGPRARGPQRRRQRAEPLARRQPDHEALPQASRSRVAGRSTRASRGRSRAT